jgi:serine/threonine protein kinase
MTGEETIERVLRVLHCEDLFGVLEGTSDEKRRTLQSAYRELAQQVHPDKHPAIALRAQEAFVALTRMKEIAERKIRAGTYGDRRPPPDARPPTVITTRTTTYRVGEMLFAGDVCDHYACSFDDQQAVLKIARSPSDDDLVENEANVLGDLYPRDADDEKFRRYLPRLIDSFRMKSELGTLRRVVLLPSFGPWSTLEDVQQVYPRGLDFRDVVWMFKRLLVGLGWVHRQGYVHGAIVPPHVLVHPVHHGARIMDWGYAVKAGEKVRARVKRFADLYAPEVAAKEPATPATDIYMAARCARSMLDRNAPARLLEFLSTLTVAAPKRRPDDAWRVHEELDELLLRLVGKPKYRPLAMPAKA